MTTPLRVLIVEDRPADAELMLHELRKFGYEPTWERVEDEAGYLTHLSSSWDVILADYLQPTFNAVRALQLLQARELNVPLIVVTGVLGDEQAVQCLRAGAVDYLIKDRLARLGQAVQSALEQRHARDEEARSARKLRDSEAFHRTLFESVDDGLYVTDLHGTIVMANEAIARRFGGSKEVLLGKSLFEVLPADKAKAAEHNALLSMETGTTTVHEIEYAAPSEMRVFQVRKVPLRNDAGELRGVVSVSRDITEIRQVEHDLRFWRHEWEEVFQSIGDPTIIVDGDHRIVSANRSALRLGGRSEAQELVGKSCCEILKDSDCDRTNCPCDDAQTSGRQVSVEVHSESLGGTFIVSATPIADRTSDQHRTILSLKDITALRDGIARLDGALRGTIQAMAAMVERRDPYTAGHERRVCKLAMAIVEEMALSEQQTTAIELAAVIHDVGKIGVPAEILSKPGALSSIEFELVKSHSQVGYEILKDIAFPWPIAQIVWQHHERLDGSGYPLGLRSEEILLEARVIAVADVVEAMSSHRPYRPAHTMVETVAEISNDRGIRYDAAVVDACLKVLNAAGSQVADIWSEGGAGSG